jgi:hypothetical protein
LTADSYLCFLALLFIAAVAAVVAAAPLLLQELH